MGLQRYVSFKEEVKTARKALGRNMTQIFFIHIALVQQREMHESSMQCIHLRETLEEGRLPVRALCFLSCFAGVFHGKWEFCGEQKDEHGSPVKGSASRGIISCIALAGVIITYMVALPISK